MDAHRLPDGFQLLTRSRSNLHVPSSFSCRRFTLLTDAGSLWLVGVEVNRIDWVEEAQPCAQRATCFAGQVECAAQLVACNGRNRGRRNPLTFKSKCAAEPDADAAIANCSRLGGGTICCLVGSDVSGCLGSCQLETAAHGASGK